MALYSLHHSSIGRTTHAVGTAAAHVAYVTRRRAASAVLSARLPAARPGEAYATRAWFNEQEVADRKNARVADRVMVALPIELDHGQRLALVHEFAEAATLGRAPWLGAIHAEGKDSSNPHLHLLIRDRDPTTGKRAVGLSEKKSTDWLRSLWEEKANAALAAAGVEARIDRRTLVDQGIEREPQIHIGPKPAAIESRGLKPQSQVRSDGRGREIRWPEIDQGRSRSERRAEIIVQNDHTITAPKVPDERTEAVPAEIGVVQPTPAAVNTGRNPENPPRREAPGGDFDGAGDGRGDEIGHRVDPGTSNPGGGGGKSDSHDSAADPAGASGSDGAAGSPRDRTLQHGPSYWTVRAKIEIKQASRDPRLAEILALAARVSADAGLGPVGRMMRDFDAREREAHERIRLLSVPIEEPVALGRLRDDRDRSSDRRSDLRDQLSASEAKRAELARTRPGVWGWIMGSARAHNAEIKKIETEIESIAKDLDKADSEYDAARSRLERRKGRWAEEKNLLENSRYETKKGFRAELEWLATARVCIGRNPLLSIAPDLLDRAVAREQRRESTPPVTGPRPGYRPR